MIDVFTVDYEAIYKGINSFRAVFHMDPYLIMSRKTARYLEKDAITSSSMFAETLKDIESYKEEDYTAQLVGCKIAFCNDVPYGKIDMR